MKTTFHELDQLEIKITLPLFILFRVKTLSQSCMVVVLKLIVFPKLVLLDFLLDFHDFHFS
jgi:hypothetical protein